MRATKSLALAMAGLLLATGLACAQSTEIRIGVALEPPALDPTAGAAEAIDVVVYQNIFEGLTRIDQTGAVQPGLATAWTITEDGLSYRFTLAQGVTFHDGTSFDAEDVKFTFERLLADDSVNAQKALYQSIAAVTVIDPQTVEITLSRPDGLFLFNLGRGDAVIVAPESADNNANEPIGTGPFAFVQWDRGSRVILEQYGPYWGEKPALTKASYVFIGDTATMTNALLAGDIDGTNNFAPEALAVFEGNPQFKVLVGSTEGETILATNNARAPFDTLAVRQAMAHAINRHDIIEGATYGYGVPIGSHFAPHHPYYVDLTETYPFDLDAAKTLLAGAGYPEGFSATLKLPPVAYARLSGQIIASEFAKIGVRLELINMEWAQWLEDVFANKDFDLTIISHVEPFDLSNFANPNYYWGYQNPRFNELYTRIKNTPTAAERNKLLGELQKLLADDAVLAWLFQPQGVTVANKRVQGLWKDSPIFVNDLSALSWN